MMLFNIEKWAMRSNVDTFGEGKCHVACVCPVADATRTPSRKQRSNIFCFVSCPLWFRARGSWKRHEPMNAVCNHPFDRMEGAVFKDTLVCLIAAFCGWRVKFWIPTGPAGHQRRRVKFATLVAAPEQIILVINQRQP